MALPERLSAVLFDMDGVIINSIDKHVIAWEQMFRDEDVIIDGHEIKLREGEKAPFTFRNVARQYGVEFTDSDVDRLVEKKRSIYRSLGGVTVYPPIFRILDHLRKSGIKTALVTGSSITNMFVALTGEDLARFDLVLTAEDYTHGKPEPEPYLKAVELLTLEKSGVAVVENAPLGVQAARAAGLFCIAVGSTLAREDLKAADLYVEDHEELEKLLTGGLV